jgi:hypothetical protein
LSLFQNPKYIVAIEHWIQKYLVDFISKEENMHQCFDFHPALGPKVEVVGKEH